MSRERVSTSKGPQAIGPYSQAIIAGEFVFVSGQIPLDPATMELIEGGIEDQTDRVHEEPEGNHRGRGLVDVPGCEDHGLPHRHG